MIDLERDDLIPLRDVPGWLAERGILSSQGNPIQLRTIYEWINRGALDVVKFSRTYTSAQALTRLGQLLAERPGVTARRSQERKKPTKNKAWEQRQARAKERLEAAGW